jgi:hypothetical protein
MTPSFVGDNVQAFLQDKNVHLNSIKCKKVIVLSFLHEWKNNDMFTNKNRYFYISLTPNNKPRYGEDDLLVIMLAGHY